MALPALSDETVVNIDSFDRQLDAHIALASPDLWTCTALQP